jgi:hypothetical protein
MGFIREELERVAELTRELNGLKATQAAPRPTPNGARPPLPEGGRKNGRPGAPDAPAALVPPVAADRGAAGNPAAAPPQGQGDDIHGWLCRRMAAIQEERQTRWQKILNCLTGRKPAEQPAR